MFLNELEFFLGSKKINKKLPFTNKATFTQSAQLVCTCHVWGLRSCDGIESWMGKEKRHPGRKNSLDEDSEVGKHVQKRW